MSLLALRSTAPRRGLRFILNNKWETDASWISSEQLINFWRSYHRKTRFIRYDGDIFIVLISDLHRLHAYRFIDPFIGEIAYSRWRQYYGKQQNVNGQ